MIKSLVYTLPPGMSPGQIEKIRPELEYALGKSVDITSQGKAVIITLHETNIPRLMKYQAIDNSIGTLSIPVGHNGKQLLTMDMSEEKHFFVEVELDSSGSLEEKIAKYEALFWRRRREKQQHDILVVITTKRPSELNTEAEICLRVVNLKGISQEWVW